MNSRVAIYLLAPLFVASGFAALLYEVVWLQLLRLIVGGDSVPITVVLATYMGGMALGSALSIRIRWVQKNPLLAYAALEAGAAVSAGLGYLAVPLIKAIYYAVPFQSALGVYVEALVCALVLLPLTLCLGATLPAVAHACRNDSGGDTAIGSLYTANLLGAIGGVVAGGFYLLPAFSVGRVLTFAAAINLTIAGIMFAYGRGFSSGGDSDRREPLELDGARTRLLIAVCISGGVALACEVVWTRLLSVRFGATTYAFAVVLATFLLGLAIGSALASITIRFVPPIRRVLKGVQLCLVPAIAYAAYRITEGVFDWRVVVHGPVEDALSGQFDWALRAMLPATVLWGAMLPLSIAAFGSSDRERPQSTAYVYALNTIGSVLGTVVASQWAFKVFGAEATTRGLLILTGFAALMLLTIPRAIGAHRLSWKRIVPHAFITVGVIVSCVMSVEPVPVELYLWGRVSHIRIRPTNVVELVHGENFSVAVNRAPDDSRYLHINGKVVASTVRADMRLQRMLGHLPAMTNSEAKSVLIIGLGAGVTSGSFVPYPGIERIVICEIEPAVAEVTGRHLGFANHRVLEDPRVEVIFDDGRHYLETAHEKFDIISTDPIHPWMKGSSALFTQEFFERAKERLNPGGVIAQWVPLYESDLQAVQIQLKTMATVFEHTTLWNSHLTGEGYDVVALGQSTPSPLSAHEYARQVKGSAGLRASLESVGLFPFEQLQATYVGAIDIDDAFYEEVPLNLDAHMILEYEAGKALNYQRASAIFQQLADHATR